MKKEAYHTGCSQAVPHPSTIPARRCLTSVIRRERVCSSWYGRRQRLYVFPSFYFVLSERENKNVEVTLHTSIWHFSNIVSAYIITTPTHEHVRTYSRSFHSAHTHTSTYSFILILIFPNTLGNITLPTYITFI